MNAEGAAGAGGAAYAPLEAPYAPVSYAPNVEVGAGADSYALPPARTLAAGGGAAAQTRARTEIYAFTVFGSDFRIQL